MRRFFKAGVLIAACVMALNVSHALAQTQDKEIKAVFKQLGRSKNAATQASSQAAEPVAAKTGSDVELASCNSCGPMDLDLGIATNGCTGQFYIGGEYLYVRPTYSQALAFVSQDITNPAVPVITYNNFDFDHESNFRVYGGYRLCECGCDIRFAYSSLGGDSSFATPTVDATGTVTFFSPLEVFADQPGDMVSGSASVDLDVYDLDVAKTIPLGSPLGCGCDCTDACGCWCPAWDITWHGGVRAIDYDSAFSYSDTRTATAVAPQTSVARTSFSGAGLRTGMTGRRYFGRSGFASVFLRGDISLLLGDLDIVAESVDGNRFSTHRFSNTQIIPVTEIEAGGTLMVTCNLTVSAGYMLAAYHDLGYRVEYPFDGTPTGAQLDNFDDANILGWDGFFLRTELTF